MHLPGAAPELGIDRRGNDADFLDQVGTRVRACQGAIVVPPVGDVKAIARDIHRAEPAAGEVALKIVLGWTCAVRCSQQTHYIAAAQRQVAHLVFGKNSAHR